MTVPFTGNPGANAPAAPAGPAKTGVELASDAARALIAGTGHAIPAPHHSSTQPRTEDGAFHKSAVREVGSNVPADVVNPRLEGQPAAPEAPPVDGQAPPAGDPPVVDPNAPPAGEPAADGESGANDLVVTLPPRNAGEDPIEIEVSDPAVAEEIRRLNNGYMRGEEARAYRETAEQSLRQVTEFEEMLAYDPGGVALQAWGDDPATLEHVALYLLTRPEVFDRIKDKLAPVFGTTLNGEKFENLSLRMENERNRKAAEFSTIAEQNRTYQNNAREVSSAVVGVIPPNWSDEQAAVFFQDALRDIKEYATSSNRMTIPVSEVPLILAARMKANGIDPVKAAAAIAQGAGSNGNRSSANRVSATRPAATGAAPLTPPPQRTGSEMVRASAARRAVASLPGAGAGTGGPPPAIPTFDPSKGSAIQQTIEAHRAALAAGRSMAN